MDKKTKEVFLETGLSFQEARKRLERFGKNELARKKDISQFKIFLSQFKSPLIYVLVLAGLVTFFLGEVTDSLVIFVAVLVNTFLGFYQEQKAQRALIALRGFLIQKAKVIREGQIKEIEAAQLVPGDLVLLTIGSLVPADGVLLEATDFSVNEAILTGESLPVLKTATSKIDQAKKENQVFMGTTVSGGIGKMVVTATGKQTEIGKIGKSLGEIQEEKTPLQEQIDRLAKVLAVGVGISAFLLFVFGEILGYKPLEMFITSVAVAVAAIPEGLVVTLTVILALGMQRILKRKALVRKLLAAETLGSVSVICADKTGTLTEGKMKVVDFDLDDQISNAKQELMKAAVLCNDMRDPLEIAMFLWAKQQLGDSGIEKLKKEYLRINEIPFSPQSRYIATLYQSNLDEEKTFIFLSGAPEVVLGKCKIEKEKLKIWEKKFEEYGGKGYRLVGFAFKKFSSQKRNLESLDLKDFSWLGLLLYEDPVRPEVKEVLKECQQAGIKVKVITGDYLETALAVLEKLGFKIKKEEAIKGEEMEKISPEELKKRIDKIVLFARTSPFQKLKIVQALKEKGEVVAMMGDGVNDALALKTADIGVVVGEAQDVAKETAEMVLLDSNFSTIVRAIEEGRAIFENIKKVVLYLLSDSFSEIILIGGSILMGLPLPLSAAQILWVNLFEDSLPAIALAFEPKEKEVMFEPPRERKAAILNFDLRVLIFIIGLFTSLILLAFYLWLLKSQFSFYFIQTLMFVALGINSLFYIFSCRSFRKTIFQKKPFENQFLVFSVIFGFFLLIGAVYLPPLRLLFKTHALGVREWFFLSGIGILNLLAIEASKWVFLLKKKKYN